ncbi:hypothetical protein MTO96_034985 [Rhipicephalus appendiculatus]
MASRTVYLHFHGIRSWCKHHVPLALLKFFFGEPQQCKVPRIVFGFIFGLFMGYFFYLGIVRELFTTELTLRCMGTAVILLTGAGYALSGEGPCNNLAPGTLPMRPSRTVGSGHR